MREKSFYKERLFGEKNRAAINMSVMRVSMLFVAMRIKGKIALKNKILSLIDEMEFESDATKKSKKLVALKWLIGELNIDFTEKISREMILRELDKTFTEKEVDLTDLKNNDNFDRLVNEIAVNPLKALLNHAQSYVWNCEFIEFFEAEDMERSSVANIKKAGEKTILGKFDLKSEISGRKASSDLSLRREKFSIAKYFMSFNDIKVKFNNYIKLGINKLSSEDKTFILFFCPIFEMGIAFFSISNLEKLLSFNILYYRVIRNRTQNIFSDVKMMSDIIFDVYPLYLEYSKQGDETACRLFEVLNIDKLLNMYSITLKKASNRCKHLSKSKLEGLKQDFILNQDINSDDCNKFWFMDEDLFYSELNKILINLFACEHVESYDDLLKYDIFKMFLKAEGLGTDWNKVCELTNRFSVREIINLYFLMKGKVLKLLSLTSISEEDIKAILKKLQICFANLIMLRFRNNEVVYNSSLVNEKAVLFYERICEVYFKESPLIEINVDSTYNFDISSSIEEEEKIRLAEKRFNRLGKIKQAIGNSDYRKLQTYRKSESISPRELKLINKMFV